MSLIHETGAGLPDAESLASVAFSDTYHGARGNTSWDELDLEVKEASLRKATDYLEITYTSRWIGARLLPSQSLAFPRNLTSWGSVVPVPVQRACAELAARVATGVVLIPDAEATITREKIDVFETVYAAATGPRFPVIDAMLASLLAPVSSGGGGFSIRLHRV